MLAKLGQPGQHQFVVGPARAEPIAGGGLKALDINRKRRYLGKKGALVGQFRTIPRDRVMSESAASDRPILGMASCARGRASNAMVL